MRMIIGARTATLISLILLCPAANADFGVPPGTVRVEPVFDKASLVCNCFVESIEDQTYPIVIQGRASTRHDVAAHVTVRDLYKSDDSGERNFQVRYSLDEQRGQRVAGSRQFLSKGETALLFLAKTGTQTFEFADDFIGATEFTLLPVEQGEIGMLKLQKALTAVAQNKSSIDQLRALRVLLGFDHISDDTVSTVMPLTQSHEPETALTALGVLLRTKSVDSVERLRRYMETYTSDTEPLALYVIGPELSEITNPKALLALEALSGTRFRSIRNGALDGVRKIRDPKSIRFLVSKLDDGDTTIQYVALISLAEILRKYDGDFAPSMYLFDKKPQHYIGLWKQWWTEEGSKLYPPASPPS